MNELYRNISPESLRGLPTKVSSIRTAEILIDIADKLGVNKSQVFTEALLDRIGVEGQKEYYRYLADIRYKEYEEAIGVLENIEYIEGKVKEEEQAKWDKVLEKFRKSYNRTGDIDMVSVQHYSLELGVPMVTLRDTIQKEVVEGV